MRCDCCVGTFVDEVGAMLIEEAIREYHDALEAKATREAAEWRKAEQATQDALRQAGL